MSGDSDGCAVFCDTDGGCKPICGLYFYDEDGEIVYFEENSGKWISPTGYWLDGKWHSKFHESLIKPPSCTNR